jgi:hypothetical protein
MKSQPESDPGEAIDVTPPEEALPASTHHDDIAEFQQTVKWGWDKFGMPIVLAVLIAMLGLTGYRWLTGREERALEEAYSELADTTDPAGKEDVAAKYESLPGFSGNARLVAADLRLHEAVFGTAGNQGLLGSDANKPLSLEEKNKRLDQAAAGYDAVIKANQSPLQVFAARFGLAAVRETQGDFIKAREQYARLQEDAKAGYPSVAAQAATLAASLDRITAPVVFPPKPPPKAASNDPLKDILNSAANPLLINPVTPTAAPEPKPETPGDKPKADAPKTDAPKPEAPKPDAPKTDSK